MASPRAATSTLWEATCRIAPRPALTEDASSDVCVIGAGISGMTTAYLLAVQGNRVVVVDDGSIGGGMTSHTTAHLTDALDDRYYELERLHGARRCPSCGRIASRRDCLHRGHRERRGHRLRFRAHSGIPLSSGGRQHGGTRSRARRGRAVPACPCAVCRLRPVRSASARASSFRIRRSFIRCAISTASRKRSKRSGGRIHCGTHATSIESGDRITVSTKAGRTIEAGSVVVATNVPINDRLAMHTKQAPYLTYVIALAMPRDAVQPALWWDTRQSISEGERGDAPYHYVRTMRGRADDFLIVGGEDHKLGQESEAERRFLQLESWTRARWPEAREVRYRWSGQVMEPVDALAYIGRNPGDEHVYVVTGDSGNGMTHGTIAGILLSDLIGGRDNPWSALYDPSRKTLSAIKDFAKENLNVAAQYVRDYAGPADISIPRRSTAAKALSYGADSRATRCTATTQASCTSSRRCARTCVASCTGTPRSARSIARATAPRFDCAGKVINGPANSDLAPVTADAAADK
jgi:glycine/D-amino acid oxidase-like deaminating enzyme